MKKQFLGILAMLSCFAFLGGCLEDTAADKNSIPGNSITSEAPGEGAVVNFKAVKAILKGMYDQDVYSYNNVDFEVTNVIPDVQGTDYTLTWSVDVDSVKLERNGDVTKVNVDEASPVDVDYVLTATITAPNGESDTQNFRFTVKAVSQYVTATITGKPLENTPYKFHLYQSSLQQDMYFAGAMDGYYFKTTTESSEAVDIYAEYVEGSETNFNLYFKKDVVDAASGETQKDVKHYIGMRVSADGGHNNIVFDTAGPVSEFYWSDTYKTIITMLDEDRDGNKNVEFYLGNYGTLKTISGSVASQHYGKDGNNVGNLVGLVDRTTVPAADKVANTINTLGLKNSYQCDTEVDLPERGAMYPEVLISWACDSELVTIEGGKMTFANVTDATEVVLKATVTCGDISETKDVTITIASALPADGSTLTIPQALEIGKNLVTETTQKYYISGTITGFYTNGTTYGNVYIKDAEGNEILIYGLYSEDGSVRYDKMETKPVEGDFIKVYGVLTQYNGTAQFKNAWLIEHVVGEGGGEGGGDVVDPTPDANSYELSFADVANRTQGDTTIQVWEQNGIKVTNNKASSTSNVNLNYYNPVRFYKNSEVIIEFPGMTKLVVVSNKNYSDNPYVDYFTQALPVGTNFTVEDTTITIVFPAAQDSFTFTCSAGQVRLMSLTVYSGEVGGGETPDPELPPVEHEHVFVDGKCECGAEDPNYEAPVEGEWTTVVPEVGKAYIFGMTQGNLNNTVYYLAGGMDGYYMATTTDASAAIQTYIEATDGGYYFYTYVNDVKTYINMVVSGTHINGAYEATASTVYTIDETNKTLIAVVNDTDYWFGTRNDKTYTTMGPCAVSYKGFYGEFYTNSNEGGETPDPELPPVEHEHVFVDGKCECGEEDPNYVPPVEGELTAVVPEVGKAYIFGMTQGNLNNTVYYLAGGMDGYYMATTTDASAAIQTYIEATDGGYYFYTYVNDVKTYINMVVSGTHVNGAYEATASTVYTIDETNKTLIAVVNDTDYWFGTRNDKTYTTMGPCAVSYKGFYGEFYTNSNEGGETPDPELPPIEHEHVFVDGKCECGEEDPNYVPPHEHNYEAVVTAPTCTEAGYTTYTCSCGDSYTADEVAATGHNYVDGACSVCGLAEVHEHNYEAVVTAPTCTAAGFTTYTCACGDSYTEEGEAATGHSYNSVVTDPTCGVAGYTTYTCSLCNDSYVADEVAATGEHSGYAEDYKCDACSMVVEPEADTTLTLAQAIKLADALGIGKYSTNSYYLTCEIVNIYNTQYGNANVTDADGTDYVLYGLYKDGVRYDSLEYKPVKGDTITVYGPVGSYNATSYQMKNAEITEIVAHTHDYQDVVTEPTCTADGYTTHTCSICENTYTDSEVAATGHNYVEGTCSVCGAVEGAQPVVSPLATFEFGANGTAAHVDGNDLGTSKSYTENGYTLALTDMSKVYGVAYDATGNSCIKLGTSSKAGSFSFTVDENVTEVIIKVAGYKANNGQVIINDTSYTINTTSNNGEYTEIKIDTTETKAITLSTGSTKATYRAMINSITFVGNAQ